MVICTSMLTTRSRTSGSRSVRPSRRPRRQDGHPPLRPCLRAARRSAVARGGRSLGPARTALTSTYTRARIGSSTSTWRASSSRASSITPQVTLHVDNLRGDNAHHQCETIFKAFGRALRMAPKPTSAPPGASRRPRKCSDPGRAMTAIAMSSISGWATCARSPRRSSTWRRRRACRRGSFSGRCRPQGRVSGPGCDARLHAPARAGGAARRGDARGGLAAVVRRLRRRADAVRAQRRGRHPGPGHPARPRGSLSAAEPMPAPTAPD
jgi:hypothetical protein